MNIKLEAHFLPNYNLEFNHNQEIQNNLSSSGHTKQKNADQLKEKGPIAFILFNQQIKTPKQSKLSLNTESNYLKTASSQVSSFYLDEEKNSNFNSTSSFHSSVCSDRSDNSIIFFKETECEVKDQMKMKTECEPREHSHIE